MLKYAEAFVHERIAIFCVENRRQMLISLIDLNPNFNNFCIPDF